MLPIQLKQDSLVGGIIWGVLIPFVGVAVLMILDETITDMNILLPNNTVYGGQKNRTLFLLAICLNLIPFQIYRNRKMDKGLRGVSFPTMFYAFLWLFYFASSIF